MGIIPVAPYDWVGLINSKIPIEHSQVVAMSQWDGINSDDKKYRDYDKYDDVQCLCVFNN